MALFPGVVGSFVRFRFWHSVGIIAVALAGVPVDSAQAQLRFSSSAPGASQDEPVYFTANQVNHNRETGIITATGNIQAWQGQRILRADSMTYNTNTGVMTANGHITLMEPDGQILFADSAELTDQMKEGVLTNLRGLLANNGRIAANGIRRSNNGATSEMSRLVYSACNACQDDPMRAPLWQIRADTATHDAASRTITYHDVTLDMMGIPVLYVPTFWHADPSVQRQSGLLVPTYGTSTFLGPFVRIPYYWVLDDQSDVTVTPLIAADALPSLGLEYRRRFNSGMFTAQGSGTFDQDEDEFKGHIFSRGRFNYDDTWRWGFDLNRASDDQYLNRYRITDRGAGVNTGADIRLLTSQLYGEGFGIAGISGTYARLDSRIYQGLRESDDTGKIPFVLPRLTISSDNAPSWGGRLGMDAGFFSVLRESGTDTRRLSSRVNYQYPLTGMFGEQMTISGNIDLLAYYATDLERTPNNSPYNSATTARLHPQVAYDWRLPMIRHSESMGSQLIEPMVQLVAGPNTGSQVRTPNEDSLDLEFTDANLFGFNKFPGQDRLEGGFRANYALHGAWYWNNMALDGLIGQSWRAHSDATFAVGSGLENNASDVVSRVTFMPTDWLDLTWRARFDSETWDNRLMDTVVGFGVPEFRVNVGYLMTAASPYLTPTQERNEIGVGFNSRIGRWRFGAFARRDLETEHMVSSAFSAGYEDECFIFDIRYQRRFTEVDDGRGDTSLLFRLVFKTVGELGFSAL